MDYRAIKVTHMKLIKILTALLVLIALQIAAAQWFNVPPPAEAKNLMVFTAGVPVAADGPNVYYYTGTGLGESDYTSGMADYTPLYQGGGNISIAVAGTATKLGAQVDTNGSAVNYKICLLSSAGSLLTSCTGTTSSSADPQWLECNINQAVTATSYQAFVSAESNILLYYNSVTPGLYHGDDYPNCPTTSGTEDASGNFAVRIYVD
jgi:hypothetical protein